ncbi:MAG TPA: Sec-independent protein translocase protein TatB [Nitriliruptoraceae bacterium]|nr:Sec-independent protein translocase protein TatB [Nitriliruptoraceae bacterium]
MTNAVGWQEILVILVVGLIVFGPDKLPGMARKGAQMLARFRSEASDAMDELRRAADIGDIEEDVKAVSADMRRMRTMVSDPTSAMRTTPRRDEAPPPVDLEAT